MIWASSSQIGDGATLDQAKKRVSDYLMSKYAASLIRDSRKMWVPNDQGLSGDRFRSLMCGAIAAQVTTTKLLR